MSRTTLALGLSFTAAALAAALGGCSIPKSDFAPTADAGGMDGPPSDVLAIVPSVTALTVDEDGNKEFTVKLNLAPSAPLTVQVDSPSTAIGLTIPDMTFDASNFSQPRT